MYSLALIIFVVSEKKTFEHFPIGSNVNLCPAVVAILDFRSPSSSRLIYLLKPVLNRPVLPRQQGSMLIYVLRWRPSWISDRHIKQKFCRGPSNDHSWAVWFQCFNASVQSSTTILKFFYNEKKTDN